MRFIGLSLAVGMFFCMMQLATAQSRTDFGASVNRAPTREFLQPFNLMPNRQQNILGNQFGCGGGGVSVKGSEVRVDLKIEYSHYAIWNPDTGQNDEVYLRTYNDCPIGPTLTIHPGDTLLLNLKNNLPANSTARCPEPLNTPNCFNSANMHTHGLHVSPAGNSDNVLISVDPQTTFPYRYDIPSNHPSGTFWYHSHRHGSTALSVTSGMEGVLIVKGNRKYQDAAQNDGVVDIDTILHDRSGHEFPERILLFQQIAYACFDDPAFQTLIQNRETGQWECPTGKTGVVENYRLQFGFAAPPNRPNEVQDVWLMSGRYTAINGKVQPIFQARAGEIERWRMVHGGVRDTINLQVVKASGELIATSELDDLSRNLQSLPRDQLHAFVNQSCGGAGSTDDVLQYEFAVDGLTRQKIWPKSLNVLNPGQRSDALVFFKEPGVYCLLDQRGDNANTIIRQGGRIGSKSRQLLGIVVVKGGEAVSVAPDTFIRQTLTGANADLPQSVRTKLEAFDISDFAFFPPSQPHGGDLTHATIAKHPTALFVTLTLPLAPGAQLPPNQPSPNPDIAAMVGMVKNDEVEVQGSTVLAYDHDTTYQAKLGTVDEWTLGVTTSGPGTLAAPHVFHIHVNPFQIMDIKDTTSDQSIYDANGKCKPIYLEPTAPDPANPSGAPVPNPVYSPEYCDQFHVFRDTMFLKENFLVTARTAYDDFIGEFVMHCHILDHEDQGMMQNVTIVSSDDQASPAPLKSHRRANH